MGQLLPESDLAYGSVVMDTITDRRRRRSVIVGSLLYGRSSQTESAHFANASSCCTTSLASASK
jgi:hypothetical protein